MITVRRSPLLIVISAPSGAGKTTLCNNLLSADRQIKRAITCTTRPPRVGEQDGVDYYFLTESEFDKRLKNNEFLEHACVHSYNYGTLKLEVLDKLRNGIDVLLNIDVQGAASVRRIAKEIPELARALVTVFIGVDSLDVLERRLKNRSQDSPEVIQRRLQAARSELEHWQEYDYLIITTTESEDLRKIQAIVEAERMRVSRLLEK